MFGCVDDHPDRRKRSPGGSTGEVGGLHIDDMRAGLQQLATFPAPHDVVDRCKASKSRTMAKSIEGLEQFLRRLEFSPLRIASLWLTQRGHHDDIAGLQARVQCPRNTGYGQRSPGPVAKPRSRPPGPHSSHSGAYDLSR